MKYIFIIEKGKTVCLFKDILLLQSIPADCLVVSLVDKLTSSQDAFHHVGSVAAKILIQITIYSIAQFTAAVHIIHLPACPNTFPLFPKK